MAMSSKFAAHAELVEKMADTLGVDVEELMQRGRLSPEELDESVLRCIGCLEVGACQHFLAEDEDAARDEPPGFCRNKEFFEALKAG